MRIATFDMGTRNFAFCVEEVDELPAPNRRVKAQFDIHGHAVPEYQNYLDHAIYARGRLVEMKCIDLESFCKQRGDMNLYLGLSTVLNAYTPLWDRVDVFLVEQQMSYGRHKSNIQALRLAQHTLTYFLTIYGPFRTIKEFASTHKTRVLGCPREQRKTHKQRKQFAIELASQILDRRQDPLYDTFCQLPKRDDVSDCLLMIQAFKALAR
jgi:hypothetical protein